MPGLRHTDTMQLFLSLGIYDLKGRFSSLFGVWGGWVFFKLLKSSLGFEIHIVSFSKALNTGSPDIGCRVLSKIYR